MKLINWIRKEKIDKGTLNVMDVTERILGREWDTQMFYFPTYANDHLLHMLECDENIVEDEDNYIVPEDPPDFAKIKVISYNIGGSNHFINKATSILGDLLTDIHKENAVTTRKDNIRKKTQRYKKENKKQNENLGNSEKNKSRKKTKDNTKDTEAH